MVRAQDGYHIYGWMKTELNLEGGELLAFAIIYSFVKGYAGKYTGNTSYLSEWMGWSENTSRKYISKLVEKGLIIEQRGRENNSPFCHYKLSKNFYEKHPAIIEVSPRKNCGQYPAKIAESTPQNLRHNIEDNVIKKEDNTFIPPTPKEVAAYVRSRGFADPEGFADYYIEINNNRNWRMKSGKEITNWKNNIVSAWEKNHKDHIFRTPQPQAQAPTFNDFVNSLQ